MKSDGLRYFTDTYLTTVGLLLFFFIFVSVLYFVFRKDKRNYFSEMEKLPLD